MERPPLAAPRRLWLLLALFALLAGISSVIVPPFETPDEIWRYAFIQQLAEGGGCASLLALHIARCACCSATSAPCLARRWSASFPSSSLYPAAGVRGRCQPRCLGSG